MPDNISFVQEQGVISMILASSPFVRLVLLVLIVLSICSWAITIAKFLQFRRAKKDSDEFGTIFWETRNFVRIEDSRRLISSPLAQAFTSGFRELNNLVHSRNKPGQQAAQS
jgi:biopolymer transport protein TolQ